MTHTKTDKTTKPATKLDKLISLLRRPKGADLAQMMSATGWQAHSVRGAIAGSIKRKGWVVSGSEVAGRRVYKITEQSDQ